VYSKLIHNIVLVATLCVSDFLFSQSVSGTVMDENNQPIAFANVYVKYTTQGTYTDEAGKYFLRLEPGSHNLVFSVIGYTQKEITVVVRDKSEVIKNIWLQPSSIDLDEMVVSAKRKDPAYEIIKNVIENKDKYLNQFETCKYNVYLRATDQADLTEKELQRLKEKEEKRLERQKDNVSLHPDSQSVNNILDTVPKMNMVEAFITVNYQAPNNIKEITTSFKKLGSKFGLYYTSTTDGDFNFYENLITVPKLGETPFVSPLSRTAFLTYKYSLEETIKKPDGSLIFKIKVWPWKSGNASFKGYLFIEDNTWAITQLELTLEKGNLTIFDEFTVRQEYQLLQDSIRVLKKQAFYYYSKSGKTEFNGATQVIYSDYQFGVEFPKRFFNNELGVVEDDAEKRDSAYWNKERPIPLTVEEQKYVAYKDSIYELFNSKEYLDSLDKEFNRITLGKVFWHGQGYRNRFKKQEWWFGSAWDYVELFQVGGLRAGPYAVYFKKWESERWLLLDGGSNFGFRNEDIKGDLSLRFRYNPFKSGEIILFGSHDFELINPYDAFVNLVRRDNYIVKTQFGIGHKIELFNGFFLTTTIKQSDRQPITDYQFGTLMDNFIDNNVPTDFTPFQSFIGNATISYTFGQKYIREPKRKVILGSKFPTVSFIYEKGFLDAFSSDVNYDYIQFNVEQQIKVGTMGSSNYRFSAGQFVNTKGLSFIDYKYHRRGDPFLYSNPLYTFQLIKQTFPSFNWFYEFHYIHHFNGALINFIPLLKKSRIQAVAGGGILYVTDNDYQYGELFVGLERAFKIARRRFRFGVYAVGAQYSNAKPDTGIKFSLEMFNNRENKWRF